MKRHSTSSPCGNLVDGLPHDCYSSWLVTRRAGVFPLESSTKTVAKRARVGTRTPIVFTMKVMFLIEIPSTSVRSSVMIVLDNVLKIYIELIKLSNDNVMKKFYRVRVFHNLNFGRVFKILENFEKWKKIDTTHTHTRIWSMWQCFDGWPSRKPTENRVKRIFKINIDVIKCESQIDGVTDFQKFWKNQKFQKKMRKMKIYDFIEDLNK